MMRRISTLAAIGGLIATATFYPSDNFASEAPTAANPAVEQLAREFRAAVGDGRQPVKLAKWLSNIWADTVVITHTPPARNDGPIDGRKLGAGEIALFTEMQRVIPDFRQENVHVRADGDAIEFSEEIVGTMPDGTVHRAPTHYRLTIENGRIVRVHGVFDKEKSAPFSAVVAKAKLRTPD